MDFIATDMQRTVNRQMIVLSGDEWSNSSLRIAKQVDPSPYQKGAAIFWRTMRQCDERKRLNASLFIEWGGFMTRADDRAV